MKSPSCWAGVDGCGTILIPTHFEGWLLERSLSSAGSGSDDDEFRASGPIRAMALEVLAEWRLAELPGAFRSWLKKGAPSDDAEKG